MLNTNVINFIPSNRMKEPEDIERLDKINKDNRNLNLKLLN